MTTQKTLNSVRPWLALPTAGLVLSLLSACGDDPAVASPTDDVGTLPDTGTPDTGLPDAGTPDVDEPDAEPDVEPDVEPEPVEIGRVELTLSPARAVYVLDFRINPVAVAYDLDGEIVPDAEIVWTVSPDGAATADGDSWRTAAEGSLTFTACSATSPSRCDSQTVLVDDGPPTIEILRPQPGDELSLAEGATIAVEGIVTDSGRTPSAFVNGLAVTLDAGGRFTTELTPRFGVNHIAIVATDGVSNTEAEYALDVIWAPEYLPTGALLDPDGVTTKGVAVTALDAVQLRLNQNFMDDGRPLGAPDAEGLVLARDLADIFQLVIANLDLLSSLPNPVIASDVITLAVDELDLGSARVFVDITDSGLEVFIDFPDVYIETAGALTFAGEVLDLTGSLSISLAALVELDLNKPTRADELEVEVVDLALALESVTPNFVSAEANAIFELADSLLFGTIETVLVDTLAGSFVDQIPMLVEDLLLSLDGLLNGAPIVLDTGILPTIAISLQGEIATIQSTPRSNLTIGLDLSVATDQGPAFPDSPGVALSVPETTAPGFFSASRLQIGLKQSLVNGLLYAVWNSGALKADVSSVLPPEFAALVSQVEIDAQLPPLLTSASADETDLPFLLSVGQFQVTLGNGVSEDLIGATLRIGADIRFADGSISVVLDELPQLELWLISSTGTEPIFTDLGDLRSLIVDGLWSQLTGDLLGGLSFAIPALSGDIFAGISPALAALQLNIVLDRPIVLRNGYVIIDGGIDAYFPPAGEGSGDPGEGSGDPGEGSGTP